MKVAPYHSANPDDPDVYHDDDACPAGTQIAPQHWAAGTNNAPRCDVCAAQT